ncbi:hypothetical protein MHBO_004872 [Bonamia ostreae]|uniref:Uncharacterized protein n=1 Tax=Bonamia ostreae TaxID=126728 RepID=A0ABV2AUG9_9EUKA
MIEGVQFWPPGYSKSLSKQLASNSVVDFRDKKLKACHRVNRQCEDIISNTCESDCPNNYFQVVDFNCPQGGSKYCGKIDCGKVGQPACLRGLAHAAASESEDICHANSPAGFCMKGLKMRCGPEKILICE